MEHSLGAVLVLIIVADELLATQMSPHMLTPCSPPLTHSPHQIPCPPILLPFGLAPFLSFSTSDSLLFLGPFPLKHSLHCQL